MILYFSDEYILSIIAGILFIILCRNNYNLLYYGGVGEKIDFSKCYKIKCNTTQNDKYHELDVICKAELLEASKTTGNPNECKHESGDINNALDIRINKLDEDTFNILFPNDVKNKYTDITIDNTVTLSAIVSKIKGLGSTSWCSILNLLKDNFAIKYIYLQAIERDNDNKLEEYYKSLGFVNLYDKDDNKKMIGIIDNLIIACNNRQQSYLEVVNAVTLTTD